jgi:hypothetical protein
MNESPLPSELKKSLDDLKSKCMIVAAIGAGLLVLAYWLGR